MSEYSDWSTRQYFSRSIFQYWLSQTNFSTKVSKHYEFRRFTNPQQQIDSEGEDQQFES